MPESTHLRIVIADDEAPARARLARMVEALGEVEIVGEAATGAEVLEVVTRERPHLVFLDIQMPPPTGLEAARQILEEPDPPLVVFLTAHSEHAVEAFELRAFDYLVKPVKKERLEKTLERVRSSFREEDEWQRLLVESVRKAFPDQPLLERIGLKDPVTEDREIVRIEEVDYFTSKDEKSFARVRGKTYQVGPPLTRLEPQLPSSLFVRTHRAYIVNVERIARVVPWFHGAYNLVMKDGEEVPLSRGQAAVFKEKVPLL